MTTYYFFAFLAAGILNFIFSILVLRRMVAVGIKVSFFEIRWQIHKHLKTYRQITAGEPGQTLWPYYGYQSTLVIMIGFALLTLLSLGA